MKNDYFRKLAHFSLLFGLILLLCSLLTGFSFFLKERPDDTKKYYTSITIKEGDTLWSIAHDNITDEYSSVEDYIKEVESINHISANQITCGKKIVLPHYFK